MKNYFLSNSQSYPNWALCSTFLKNKIVSTTSLLNVEFNFASSRVGGETLVFSLFRSMECPIWCILGTTCANCGNSPMIEIFNCVVLVLCHNGVLFTPPRRGSSQKISFQPYCILQVEGKFNEYSIQK